MFFFFDFLCWQKQLGKRLNLGPLGWREDSNHYITCFFFETIVCKKDIYNINHCANIIKIFWFFSCWALYYKCIKLGVVFNFLLLFSVCPHLILTRGHDFPSFATTTKQCPIGTHFKTWCMPLQTHLLALPTKARILCLDSLMNIVVQGIVAPR